MKLHLLRTPFQHLGYLDHSLISQEFARLTGIFLHWNIPYVI